MTNLKDLIPREQAEIMPQIVDESGNLIESPDIDIINLVSKLAVLAQLAGIRKSLKKAEFGGKYDTRMLSVTDEVQVIDLINDEPLAPWIGAFILNNGPHTALIGINHAHEWLEIGAKGDRTIDHAHADERIKQLYYKCAAGETASVRIEAHY